VWGNTDAHDRFRWGILLGVQRSVGRGTDRAHLPVPWELSTSVLSRSTDLVANAITAAGCGCGFGARDQPPVPSLYKYIEEALWTRF
jgi:hypothetical protein